MNIKKIFKSFKKHQPANTQNLAIDNAIAVLSANERLGENEKVFIVAIYRGIQADERESDYHALAQDAPSVNIEFWYECAVALSTLPASGWLDTRANGRLQTANLILDKIIKHSYKVAPFWAQKITVLKQLVAAQSDENHAFKQQLQQAIATAMQHFPDEPWFAEQSQQVTEQS